MPGESITRTLMTVALGFLARRLSFELVDPFEGPDLSRAPGLPRGGLRLRNVTVRAAPSTSQPIG